MLKNKNIVISLIAGLALLFLICSIILICQENGFVRFLSALPIVGSLSCSFFAGYIYAYKEIENNKEKKYGQQSTKHK